MLIDKANNKLEVTIFNIDMISRNSQINNDRRLDVTALEFERALINNAREGLDYTIDTNRVSVARDIIIINKTLYFVVA